jgi:hypothetical protein
LTDKNDLLHFVNALKYWVDSPWFFVLESRTNILQNSIKKYKID